MSPKVSVVMSVFDGEAYLAEAIDSILHQTFEDFEFIIVNDGSRDASSEIIQEYAEQDTRIQVISMNQNVGLSRALNMGIEQAQGQYIARMDSDDNSLPSRLQQQVNYLDNHPEVGVLGSRMQVVDESKRPLFTFDVPLEHSMIVWNLFFGWTFAHPSIIIRSDELAQVGRYDETITVAQDVDLWSRLVGQTRFANLPDELLLYRSHKKSTSIEKAEHQNVILHTTLKRLLMQLWGNVSEETVSRFLQIRTGKPNFMKAEFERVKVDMRRLAESLQEVGWILPNERRLIKVDMQRLLDIAQPKTIWERIFLRNK